MHVLSLCICSQKANDRNEPYIMLVPQRNEFVFQLVLTGTLMKVPIFTEVPDSKQTHAGGNVTSCFADKLNQTHKQEKLSCVVFLSFFRLSVWLPVCLSLSFSTLTVKFTSWAKLESCCQSKQYFYEITFHIVTVLMMHCTLLFLTYHFISLTSFNFALRCIFHVSVQLFVVILKNNHVCLPFVRTTKAWKRWIFSDLFKWGRTNVIKWYGVVADSFLMTFRSIWCDYFVTVYSCHLTKRGN